MDYIIILAIFFIIILVVTNKQNIKERFSTFELINTYTNIKDAHQGIAVGPDHFYAINTSSISKHDIKTGKLVKQIDLSSHPRIKHLNGGIVVGNNLYVTNNPKTDKHRQNTIEVFNKNLEYLYYINVTGNTGSLTWIDYYDNKWWGCFAHYNDEVRYTVMVEFYHPNPGMNMEDSIKMNDLVQWHVKDRWFFPHKVIERFMPYSCSGGSFGPDGKLYVTGHDNQEIYVLNFNKNSPMLSLDHVKGVKMDGQGISWDKKRNILFGISREDKSVYIYESH